MTPDEVNLIVKSIIDLYDALPSNGKPKEDEFVVLSAIIQEDDNHHFTIITLATGTKCLGKGQEDSLGCLLCDSHAEIIAKRAFTRYLLKEALIYRMDGPLEWIFDKIDKFRLKQGYKYHLFISDNPCGDSSIYPRQTGVHFTGAKPIVVDKNENNPPLPSSLREDVQAVGILRTKVGKSTIEEKNRTTSMSCSDKLCRWQYLGCQGAILSDFFESIYFDTFIIGADPLSTIENQLSGLNRSFHERTICLGEIYMKPKIVICSLDRFRYSKCNQEYKYHVTEEFYFKQIEDGISGILQPMKPKPCGTSIHWIRDVYQIESGDRNGVGDSSSSSSSSSSSNLDPIELKKKRYTSCVHGTVEVTLSHLGALQGTIKRSIGSMESSSRLCRREIATLSIQVKNMLISRYDLNKSTLSSSSSSLSLNTSGKDPICQESRNILTCSYQYLKKSNRAYLSKREEFLTCPPFNSWICDEDNDFIIDLHFDVDETDYADVHKKKKKLHNDQINQEIKSTKKSFK